MNRQVVDLSGEAPVFRMQTMGKPVPMPRSRHFKRGWHNPVKDELSAFKAQVRQTLPPQQGPLFPRGVPVTATLTFYMRRPNDHFKGDDRTRGLRSLVPRIRPIKPDIDNLAKFVLDGMNKLVYHDDEQVVKLVVYKLQDSEGDCLGRSLIEVTRFEENELP